MTTGHGSPRSWRVTAAATLVSAYALVFVAVAIGVLYELISGAGAIGHQHLDDLAARGAIVLALLLFAGAGLLVGGALTLVREGRRALLAWPLSVFAVIGCIGEIADLAGSAGAASNLVGAGILLLAVLPLALIGAEHRARRSAAVDPLHRSGRPLR